MENNMEEYSLTNKVLNTHVIERIIPDECANKSVGKQIPMYIVIHEVSLGLGKTPSSYNLEHYENKIINDGLNGIEVGYHYLVSDDTIYHFIPDTNSTKHTGTILNYCSIGIERLVNEDINFPDAIHNQAKLAATLMVKWHIPLSNVISHEQARIMNNMEPKTCPNRMIAGQYGGFSLFYKEIKKCFQNKDLFYEVILERYDNQNTIDEYVNKAYENKGLELKKEF